MLEWIEARRKELKTQREQSVANVHACDGALQVLDAAEAEVKSKPVKKPAK